MIAAHTREVEKLQARVDWLEAELERQHELRGIQADTIASLRLAYARARDLEVSISRVERLCSLEPSASRNVPANTEVGAHTGTLLYSTGPTLYLGP